MVDISSPATWGWQDVEGIIALGGLLVVTMTGGRAIGRLEQKVSDLTTDHASNMREIDALRIDIQKHKVDSERRFVSSDTLKNLDERIVGLETRLTDALNRLGDRFDRLFDKTSSS